MRQATILAIASSQGTPLISVFAVEQAAILANTGGQFTCSDTPGNAGTDSRRTARIGRSRPLLAAHGDRLDALACHDRARAGRFSHEAALGHNAAVGHAGLTGWANAQNDIALAKLLL